MTKTGGEGWVSIIGPVTDDTHPKSSASKFVYEPSPSPNKRYSPEELVVIDKGPLFIPSRSYVKLYVAFGSSPPIIKLPFVPLHVDGLELLVTVMDELHIQVGFEMLVSITILQTD